MLSTSSHSNACVELIDSATLLQLLSAAAACRLSTRLDSLNPPTQPLLQPLDFTALPLHRSMADDSLSASELRAQYARGGSLADSQLTASQLRARHGIQANDQSRNHAGGARQQPLKELVRPLGSSTHSQSSTSCADFALLVQISPLAKLTAAAAAQMRCSEACSRSSSSWHWSQRVGGSHCEDATPSRLGVLTAVAVLVLVRVCVWQIGYLLLGNKLGSGQGHSEL